MIDGLRAAVNAYAWARRGLALRVREAEPDIAPVEWDSEDEDLLAESTMSIHVSAGCANHHFWI
jgi:hypothetical protein